MWEAVSSRHLEKSIVNGEREMKEREREREKERR
jgi:hypothetical protein